MTYPFKTGQSDSIKDPQKKMQKDRHFGKKRRKSSGLLAYYLAGGAEHRYQSDRRYSQEVENEFTATPGKRAAKDRRRVVNTKYLNCGKIMDRRKDVRRSNDNIDETAAEYEKFRRLGPGWL